jgi:uncharacterized coiled-coil protein SlyX
VACLSFCGYFYVQNNGLKIEQAKQASTIALQKEHIERLDESIKTQEAAIKLVQAQIQLSNEIRESWDAKRKKESERLTSLFERYKNEKDDKMSPKLVKILNGMESENQ